MAIAVDEAHCVSKQGVYVGNKLTGVERNVVRRNAIESDLEKMGVSMLILIKRLKRIGALYILPLNPSVRILAVLQLESSEGEPYTS